MDWKTFKKPLKNTALICLIMFIVAAIVGVAIEAMGVANEVVDKNNQDAHGSIARLILTIVSAVLMAIFAWILNAVPPLVSLNYVIVNKKYISEDKLVSHKKFVNPWWVHLVLVIFLVIVFVLSITSLIQSYDWSFAKAIRDHKNLTLCLVSFFVNLVIFEFEFNYNCYKLNHDPGVKNLM